MEKVNDSSTCNDDRIFLIDGNKLKEKAIPLLFPTDMEPCGHIPVPTQAVVISEIEGMLYRESLELIRCASCEYWARHSWHLTTQGCCGVHGGSKLLTTNEDDFCSWGKLKTKKE